MRERLPILLWPHAHHEHRHGALAARAQPEQLIVAPARVVVDLPRVAAVDDIACALSQVALQATAGQEPRVLPVARDEQWRTGLAVGGTGGVQHHGQRHGTPGGALPLEQRHQFADQRVHILSSELLPDGQLPDALAGCGKDRIAQRRHDRRQARLAHAAQRPAVVARDQMHVDLARRRRHAQHFILVKVGLLCATGAEGDGAREGSAHSHDAGAFELCAHAVRIDDRTAVDRHIDARNAQLALGINGHFHDRGDVAGEAVVRGDAQPAALGELATPPGLLRGELDDVAHPPGIDGVALG